MNVNRVIFGRELDGDPSMMDGPQQRSGSALEEVGTSAPIIATNYRPINKNTLISAVDLTVPRWHVTFCGCTLHRRGEKEWVNFPGREWIDGNGEKQYANLIIFTDNEINRRFQTAALAAIRAIAGAAS